MTPYFYEEKASGVWHKQASSPAAMYNSVSKHPPSPAFMFPSVNFMLEHSAAAM